MNRAIEKPCFMEYIVVVIFIVFVLVLVTEAKKSIEKDKMNQERKMKNE